VLLDEGTIETTKNERCSRKPDVADVELVALIYTICRQISYDTSPRRSYHEATRAFNHACENAYTSSQPTHLLLYSFTRITLYPHLAHYPSYKYCTIKNDRIKKKERKKRGQSEQRNKKKTSVAYVQRTIMCTNWVQKCCFLKGNKRVRMPFFSLYTRSAPSIVSAIRWYRPLPRRHIRVYNAFGSNRKERKERKHALVYASI